MLCGLESDIVYRSLHYVLLVTSETKSRCSRKEDSGLGGQGTGP